MDPFDWQTNKSLEETNLHMLENEIACDVSFLLGIEEANKCEIKAHKFILISRNPVFYAMFINESSTSPINVKDVEPESFKSVLRYLYSGDCCLNLDNVLSILYTSKKYMITNLIEKCKIFLEENINSENVCLIYEQSIFYDENDLLVKCRAYIENKTEEVIASHSFQCVSANTLEHILSMTRMSVNEVDLYQACVRWGENECKRRQLDSKKINNMRTVLGNLLPLIHFPVMSFQEFALISKSGLLSPEDRCFIFESMALSNNEKSTSTLSKYPLTRRLKPEPFILSRFNQFCKSNVYSGDCSMMRMLCDKNIYIKGFGISSSLDFDALQEVQIVIKQDRVFLLNKTYFINDDMKNQVIRVMLESDIHLQSKTLHSIIITFIFSGEHDQGICRRGKGGSKAKTFENFTFEFDRPDSGGLISEIIFSGAN